MASSLGDLLRQKLSAQSRTEKPYIQVTRKVPTVRWLSSLSSNAIAAQRMRMAKNAAAGSGLLNDFVTDSPMAALYLKKMISSEELIWSKATLNNPEYHRAEVTVFFSDTHFFIAGGECTGAMINALEYAFKVIRGRFCDVMSFIDVDITKDMGRNMLKTDGVMHANRDPRIQLESWQKLAAHLNAIPLSRWMHKITVLVTNPDYRTAGESPWKDTPRRLTLTNHDGDAVYINDGRVYMKVVKTSMPLLPKAFEAISLEDGDNTPILEGMRRLVTIDQVKQYFHANY